MPFFLRAPFRFAIAGLLALQLSCGFAVQAFSEELQKSEKIIPDTVVLDGSEYSREALARAFVEAAFSAVIPLTSWEKHPESSVIPIPPYEPYEHHPIYSYNGEVFKKQYPWLYEYVFREKGVPRYVAVNKWTKDLRVSLGFPNGLKPEQRIVPEGAPHMADALMSKGVAPVTEQLEFFVSEEVNAFNRVTSSVSGINISYLKNREETAANYAELRIIFLSGMDAWNPDSKVDFRKVRTHISSGFSKSSASMLFRPNFEFDLLPTSVIFTPNGPKQVDGFFLSEADNSIGRAFCFISHQTPEDLKKGLIRECLLRSLGLPDAVYQPASMLSSLWREPERAVALNEYRPARKVSFEQGAYVTEFDLYLLKILYRPEIKTGMSPYEAYRRLMDN
jgi:hypothetical protein